MKEVKQKKEKTKRIVVELTKEEYLKLVEYCLENNVTQKELFKSLIRGLK